MSKVHFHEKAGDYAHLGSGMRSACGKKQSRGVFKTDTVINKWRLVTCKNCLRARVGKDQELKGKTVKVAYNPGLGDSYTFRFMDMLEAKKGR